MVTAIPIDSSTGSIRVKREGQSSQLAMDFPRKDEKNGSPSHQLESMELSFPQRLIYVAFLLSS